MTCTTHEWAFIKRPACVCGTPLIYALIEFGQLCSHVLLDIFSFVDSIQQTFCLLLKLLFWVCFGFVLSIRCGIFVGVYWFFFHMYGWHVLLVRLPDQTFSLRTPLAACSTGSFLFDQNAQHGRHFLSLVRFLVASQRTGIPEQGNRDLACLTRGPTLVKKVQNTIQLCSCGVCGGSALQAGWWEERFYKCVSFKACVKKKQVDSVEPENTARHMVRLSEDSPGRDFSLLTFAAFVLLGGAEPRRALIVQLYAKRPTSVHNEVPLQ